MPLPPAAAPTPTAPSATFGALLLSGLLSVCLAWSALVLATATWTDVQPLNDLFPFYVWRTRAVSAAEYTTCRLALAAGAALLGGAWVVLARTRRGRHELDICIAEWRSSAGGIRRAWGRCSVGQRQLAGVALAVLTLGRLYFSIVNPEYDDAVSYELFVSKSLLATSAYYPLPNNHVLSNTIAWLFYQVHYGFWWSMRLPVLLVSTGATLAWFGGLLPRAGYRVALLATVLFSGLQLSWYHAGVGRGYWLLIGGTAVLFFASLELRRPDGRHRAAWLALAWASALGLYAVPTFAYAVASAGAWVALGQLRAGAWRALGFAAVMGAGLLAAALALYAPLLLVSGLGQLAGNGFVAPLTVGAFARGLPAWLWHTEGFLAGQRTLGTFLTLGILALAYRAWRAHRLGQAPTAATARFRELAGPSAWFMAFPYLLAAGQRVYAPERVMLYKGIFLFILLGLGLDWARFRWPRARFPRYWAGFAGVVALWGAYQWYSVVRVNPAARSTNGAYRAGLEWLARQPLQAPVLIPEPTHNLFFRFYAHSQQRQRPWRFDDRQRAGTAYGYLVAFPNRRGYFQPELPFPPAYHNAEVDIYRLPAGFALASQGWFH